MRVVIYPDHHRPAPVHVLGGDGEAVLVLHCPDGPPTLREAYGFARQEASRIGTDPGAQLALCEPHGATCMIVSEKEFEAAGDHMGTL